MRGLPPRDAGVIFCYALLNPGRNLAFCCPDME
jgi:hypothetical protein